MTPPVQAFSGPGLLLLSCTAALLLIGRGQAGEHYCPKGYQLEIDMTVRALQDERLIPQVSGSPGGECSWVIRAARLTAARQLVLQGSANETGAAIFKADDAGDKGFMTYHLQQRQLPLNNGTCDETPPQGEIVHSGLFRVLHLTDSRTFLTVSFQRRSRKPRSGSQISLRALMPTAGFCSRDMLSYHDNCYAISPAAENITASLNNIRGDAELASFTNMTELNEFIAANTARLDVHPYKRPLNLSQWVRVGLFYRARDAKVLTVLRNGSGCQLRTEEPSKWGLAPGKLTADACATVRVNESGNAVMQFGDCSQPMPALIRFPETPRLGVSCEHCRGTVLEMAQGQGHWRHPAEVRMAIQLSPQPTAQAVPGPTVPFEFVSPEPRVLNLRTIIIACVAGCCFVMLLLWVIVAVRILRGSKTIWNVTKAPLEDRLGCLRAASSVSSLMRAKPKAEQLLTNLQDQV